MERLIDKTIYQEVKYQMSCKYPKESRMHHACILCDEKNVCKDTITSLPLADSNISISEVYSPENVIPSASEANKMTNNAIDSCITQQLAEISKLIKDAIADGKFSISEDGCLKPETRKKLEALGYKVRTVNRYNESYYTISWRETK